MPTAARSCSPGLSSQSLKLFFPIVASFSRKIWRTKCACLIGKVVQAATTFSKPYDVIMHGIRLS